MLGFLKALVILPVAVVVILLAVANRGPVVVSLDPFARGAPEIALTVPLYALIFAAVALGILIGGIGTWLAAGTSRRASRSSRREAHRLRQEADRLRTTVATSRGLSVQSGRP